MSSDFNILLNAPRVPSGLALDAEYVVVGASGVVRQRMLSPPLSATGWAITGSTGSVVLVAANASRLFVSIRNASDSDLYVTHGPTGTQHTPYLLSQQDMYESPARYTGPISGIWSENDPSGMAFIEEFS